ncbi:TatD family deoxyribonuclease [Mycobacteroides abscessus subsp. abscessus]|uniref:TatD family hydrolase n=1 Tax=Mycobacteroides abscessus TaxID=36809 RepID=UPI0009276A54|nr:TatD family hydrolase [Mycobacteroides abscessus]SHY17577.1 TatD family deoxyribonuclease [Mycobacteroides abscessus subsp. abscessus]
MSRTLPPLDLHAHVATDIAPRTLEGLGAVVFAVTRSLDEYDVVSRRSDAVTVWGLGCHPRLVSAQNGYDEGRFVAFLETAALVGEVGLDGASRVPIERQMEVLESALSAVTATPRLISVHSYRATKLVLDLIEKTGAERVMLHWWLGSERETKRALELGCLFSVNQSMDPIKLRTAGVPITSLLPETDHPSGNRRGTAPRQPGQTLDVEQAIGRAYGVDPAEVRNIFWKTFSSQVDTKGVFALLPLAVQRMVRFAQVK